MLAPQTISEKMRMKVMEVSTSDCVPEPVSPKVWEMMMAMRRLNLSYSAVLIFEITAEDDHIDIVFERFAHEALDKLSLIILISLSEQQSYSFSICHKNPQQLLLITLNNLLRY